MLIKLRIGYNYVMLPVTEDNLKLAATLAELPAYDDIYDVDYGKATYYPTGKKAVDRIEIAEFSINDNELASEADARIKIEREAIRRQADADALEAAE